MKRYVILAALTVAALTGFAVPRARADLLVSSFGSNEVLRYDQTTGAFLGAFVPTGSGGLNGPRGLEFGPDGNLYVSSGLSSSVLRYSGATGAFIDAFVPTGSSPLNDARNLTFGPDRNVYVGSFANNSILRYNGTTGAFLDAFVSPSGGLNQPRGFQFGLDGNLYISAGSNNVLRYDGITGAPLPAPGQSGATFVPSGSGGLLQANGLAFGPDGNLYIASQNNAQILRYDGTTGAFLGVFASGNGLSEPRGMGFGPDGNLYVTNVASDNDILRFDGATGAPLPAPGQSGAVFVSGGSGGLNAPAFLTFTPAAVPEPSSIVLVGMGAVALIGYRWRCRRYSPRTGVRSDGRANTSMAENVTEEKGVRNLFG